jgi:signal transduction histidine kinase
MNIPREAVLAALAILTIAGGAATVARLLRARRHGLSIRLQVFLAMASIITLLNAAFAWIVVDRVQARAELFPGGMVGVMSDLAPKVALLAVLLAGTAAFAAVLIGRAVGRPIERLTQTAQRVAAGERQAALPVPQGREVRALTEALDSMRRELEERHALEAFVADLSHELKNPIASIRASAEVLEEAIGSDPEAARRFAMRIHDSAAKLTSLVSDLLALARLEAHGIALRSEAVDVAQLVRTAVEALASQAAARGVRVELKGPQHAPARGEATWLRRAIENLLANALAFSPQGGLVEIALAPSTLNWELSVTDRGPGVLEAMRPRLFSRFATTRGEQGGTGLGLALVRAVAEVHGGSAQLRSTGPNGSTFSMVVPRSPRGG